MVAPKKDKPKLGRPSLDRTERVYIRISRKEKRKLQAAAKRAKAENLSEYIRAHLLAD